MRVDPYLNFKGQCEEAFKLYEKVLGGKIEAMMTYGDSPAAEHTPPEISHWILHASLDIGDQRIMASDSPPDRYEKPQGLFVSLGFQDPAEGERVFNALAEGGTVHMPFEKTFWSSGFGMLVDRFGTPWMINCEP